MLPETIDVAPGVWRVHLGGPCESFTPVSLRRIDPDLDGLGRLPASGAVPIDPAGIRCEETARGLVVRLPLGEGDVYGFGLQLKSVLQTGKKRVLRVNSDPKSDTGDSHAPVPFFVTTDGLGVLIDTARYASVYVASHAAPGERLSGPAGERAEYLATGVGDLYGERSAAAPEVVIEVPNVQGVDIYLFAGPTMLHAIQRYVLFSGGGVLPPLWSLGVWYRAWGRAGQEEILRLVADFRDSRMPCDVLGLEPGWQKHAYSCSFTWNREKFPQPSAMLESLAGMGFKVNLWEHAFVHPESPLYDKLREVSGSVAVWDGLVPDFSLPEAREVFSQHHLDEFIAKGVSGFKLDECDNSDFLPYPWSFPEYCQFPSGLDGEQMHSLFGNLYASTITEAFERAGRETLCQSRSLGALASPLPAVLYSDLYDFDDYVRGVVNAGFSGLLWCPEVRGAGTQEEFLRRLQLAVVAPQTLINSWMLPLPPWKQLDFSKNLAGEINPDSAALEERVRKLLGFRIRLVPYLYSAFGDYRDSGIPVCRALVCDFPDDPALRAVEDQFLLGRNLMVAPFPPGSAERDVRFPDGEWIELETGRSHCGPSCIRVRSSGDMPPIFGRAGTLLPLAQGRPQAGNDPLWELTILRFGNGGAEPFRLPAGPRPAGKFGSRARHIEVHWDEGISSPRLTGEAGEAGLHYGIASWEDVGKGSGV